MARYLIDGEEIKPPSEFGIEKYNLTKSGRVASGKMTMELIAPKLKFTFSYSVISGPDKDKIESLIAGKKMFFTLTYEENGKTKTCKVYSGALKATKLRGDQGWYWKGFKFDLIQQ